MPELPDVEIFRRYAEENVLQKEIYEVKISDYKIAGSNPESIQSTLENRRFTQADRKGKFLFLQTDSEHTLAIHFGMTGFLAYSSEKNHTHSRAFFALKNGNFLHFVNSRKLGRLYLTADVQAFCQDKQIGTDALVISEADFLEKMSQKKGMIKSALMDQQFLAGIGNIYSDEILFQSGIHPKKKIDELRKKDLVDLFNTLKKILMEAIEHGANPEKLPGHFIIPHRNEGKKCPSCGGDVKKDKLSGRGFYFCPNCQN